jgi:DNA mismatch endonuclease (patch repair protein)
MAEKFSKEERSAIMAKVHSADTTPEIYVRKLLHNLGYRFRLHNTALPGKPDLVLKRYNTVIFVHGCFWHGCQKCRKAKIRPKANADYWNKKLDGNLQRDKENIKALKRLGWRVLIIWEHETKVKDNDALINKIDKHFNKENNNNGRRKPPS